VYYFGGVLFWRLIFWFLGLICQVKVMSGY
jgi:hypothetical protein